MLIGRRSGTGEALSLRYKRQGDTDKAIPWWSGQVKTDDAGRFVFTRVMPGEVDISREILLKRSASSQTIGQSHTVTIEVRPGTTARVTMGGKGRPVIGKVKAPAGFTGPIDWTFSNNSLIPKGTMIQNLTRLISSNRTRRSAGGYALKLEADGSFRVEDVEAGTYDMLIVVNNPPRDPFGIGLGNDVVASVNRELVVPPMPGGRSDQPLDLGVIALTAIKKQEAGPPAAPTLTSKA